MEDQGSFGQEVKTMLEQAGWYAGRDVSESVDYPSDVEYPSDIRMLLGEYGNLHVRSTGRGITMARSGIDFDPSCADQESSEDGRLRYFSESIGTTQYPLGYLRNDAFTLCIDSSHKVYLAGDDLHWIGNSFVEGVSNVLLGVGGKVFNHQQMRWVE